jgi:endoglucanase
MSAEFGVPGGDTRWLKVHAPFLAQLDRAGVEGCWWAAGEWWPPDYKLSLQPREQLQKAAPQMEGLRKIAPSR